MTLSRLSIALYVIGVFVSGALVGAFGYRLYMVSPVSAKTTPRPEEFREKYLAEMRTRLKLRPEQVSHVNEIMDETRIRWRQAHDSIKPTIEQIRHEQTAKIRAALEAEQQPEFDKMVAERQALEREGAAKPAPK